MSDRSLSPPNRRATTKPDPYYAPPRNIVKQPISGLDLLIRAIGITEPMFYGLLKHPQKKNI
jgi:hypothetical protein